MDFSLQLDAVSCRAEILNLLGPFVTQDDPSLLPHSTVCWTVRERRSESPGTGADRGDEPPEIVVRDGRWSARHATFEAEFDVASGLGAAVIQPRFSAFSSFLRTFLAGYLPFRSGLALHSAAVILPGGSACLFAAPSGHGKTTISRELMKREICAGVLTDEFALVRAQPTPAAAFASPFWGELPRPKGREWPASGSSGRVRSLIFLEKHHHDARQALAKTQAFRMCLERTVMRPSQRELTNLVLDAAAALAGGVPAERIMWKSPEGLLRSVEATLRDGSA